LIVEYIQRCIKVIRKKEKVKRRKKEKGKKGKMIRRWEFNQETRHYTFKQSRMNLIFRDKNRKTRYIFCHHKQSA
jgi:hypothetical protein